METRERRSFWTFIVKNIAFGMRASEDGAFRNILSVTGHFVMATINLENREYDMSLHYLTPMDEPMTFDVPPHILAGRLPDDITSNDVLEGFVKIFSKPFSIIGPPPTDVPIHRIPPSKRNKLERAQKKQTIKAFGLPEEGS